MTEQQPPDFLKHTVSFHRKVSDGNYGSTEAFLSVQFDTPPSVAFGSLEDFLTEVQSRALTAFVAVKSVVLEELGISYDLAEDGRTVVENVQATAQAIADATPDAVTQIRQAFPGAQATNEAGNVITGDFVPSDLKDWNRKDQKEWLEARLQSHPNDFYDNREAKASGRFSEKSPDFKHKKTGLGLWLDSGRRSA